MIFWANLIWNSPYVYGCGQWPCRRKCAKRPSCVAYITYTFHASSERWHNEPNNFQRLSEGKEVMLVGLRWNLCIYRDGGPVQKERMNAGRKCVYV